jgi:hypothetical protein
MTPDHSKNPLAPGDAASASSTNTENQTGLLLPKDASLRAREIAGLIGNPLTKEGVPPNIEAVLRASIEAGDAHGMLDFGMLANAAASSHAAGKKGE